MANNNSTFFDDLDSGTYSAVNNKPIWTMDLADPANEKDILKWLNGELDHLMKDSEDRMRLMQRNLALYKGIQYQTQETRTDLRDRSDDRARVMKKIVCNHLYDLTKNRVSRLIKYKPAVAILPTNDEQQDKIAAKVTKSMLDHIWYMKDFEGQLSVEICNNTMVQGEGFLFIDWDPQLGDLDENYKQAKKKADQENRKIPLLNDHGEQEKDDNGNPVWISKPVRTGDVDYRTKLASECFWQKKTRWKDVEHGFEREVMPVEELRAKYPDVASKIKSTTDAQIYDYEKMQLRPVRNEVAVYTFWHKRTEMLEEGRKIVFTKDTICLNEKFPFSHRNLPCIRLTDVDVPGEATGYSFYELVKGLTSTYNNLTNLILRNQILVSHPKWMMPVGSTKLQDLANDITIVQYKGPIAPQLIQCQPTPAEIFNFRALLKEEFQQISGVFGVSRGEPPPGIKAGVALQFLSEQESERFNELVLKWNEFIKQVAIMTLAVAGDYYDAEDQRMIRVLGKNNEWMTQFFDASYLAKDYDIRIQNSSALPQSKAARMQTLLDLSQQYPNEMPAKQVLDLLDLGQSDKFIDSVTMAIRTAEAENEKLLDVSNKMKPDEMLPEEYEDHLQHWDIHVRQIQEYSFKYQTDPNVQERFKNHILTTEMMIFEKAQKNPAFLAELAKRPLYPIFFIPPTPDQLQEAQAPVQPPAPAPLPGGPFQEMPGLPQQVPGLPVNVPPPGLEQQMATEPAAPQNPGPIQPTGAI